MEERGCGVAVSISNIGASTEFLDQYEASGSSFLPLLLLVSVCLAYDGTDQSFIMFNSLVCAIGFSKLFGASDISDDLPR